MPLSEGVANERDHSWQEMGELATSPRVDQTSRTLHRVPQGFGGPSEVLSNRLIHVEFFLQRRNDLATRVQRKVVQRVAVHMGDSTDPSVQTSDLAA